MGDTLPVRPKSRDVECPNCGPDVWLDCIIAKELASLWWCSKCHKVYSYRSRFEDVIDPHGRI